MTAAPVGIVAIKALYGDPAGFVREDGTVSPLWEARMVKIALPASLPLGWMPEVRVSSVRVNQAIAGEVDRLMHAISKAGLWTKLITYDGGYAWRPQRGSDRLSMHAFGGALDFNASTNRLGTKGDMDHELVDVIENFGWTWGGRWSRPDPMHVQWGRGY